MVRKERFSGLPNRLTLFRMATTPVLLILFPWDISVLRIFCAFLFALAALTDWADGFLARRLQLESRLGAILDPLADKLLTTGSLVLLVGSGRLWSWVAGFLLCRDVAVSTIRTLALQKGFEISVHFWGKLKTFFLDVSIVCLMVGYPLWGLPFLEIGSLFIWGAVFCSAYSWWLYSQAFWKKFF